MMSDVILQMSSKVPEEESKVINLEFTDLYPDSPVLLKDWHDLASTEAPAYSCLPSQASTNEDYFDSLLLSRLPPLELQEIALDLLKPTCTDLIRWFLQVIV